MTKNFNSFACATETFLFVNQVRKPKYWVADIILCTIWVCWSHSPAGGIHVCGGYSPVLSPLLHSLLNVRIVTHRYNFQSISCKIQLGRCKNLSLSSFSISEWITQAVFLFCWHYLFEQSLRITHFISILLFVYHKIPAWDAVGPSNHFSFVNHPKGHELVHCRFPTCWM